MNYSRFCYLSISDRHSYHVYSDTLFTIVRSDMKIKKFPENVVDQLDFQANTTISLGPNWKITTNYDLLV